MRLLVVETSNSAAADLMAILSSAGYVMDRASAADQARHLALTYPYSLILLEPALPDACGVDLCRALRRQGLRTPIIVLSDSDEPQCAIRALDAGADDFLPRPYDPGELLARIRALLRRGEPHEGSRLSIGDLEMDLLRRYVARAGKPIELRPKEFALLECLMRHPERVLSRARITDHVWDTNFDADTNLVEVYISTLRKKLGNPPLIQTVPGSGYMLTTTARPSGPRSQR
jgi:DNA-binding response OmpR family regulator